MTHKPVSPYTISPLPKWDFLSFKGSDIKSQVFAASLRNARQVGEVDLAGADIATLPFNIIGELLGHYRTIEGMKKFTEDIVPEYAILIERPK